VARVGAGSYAATIDEGWWVQRGPNGGYIAAIVLRAILAEIDDPARSPRSFTLHYTRPPVAGPAEVAVVVEKQGRTMTTASVRLTQDDRLSAIGLAALAIDTPGPSFADTVMPDAPPPESVPESERGGPPVPIRARYDTRWVIGDEPFSASGPPSEVGRWIRLAEPEPVDSVVVAALTDAWLPAVFTRLEQMVGVPTIDLTVHFRNPPPPGTEWCFARFRTTHAAHGFLEEDGDVWAPDGTLLAQSRQLGMFLLRG
jgi:acyl-CoA thioesterase